MRQVTGAKNTRFRDTGLTVERAGSLVRLPFLHLLGRSAERSYAEGPARVGKAVRRKTEDGLRTENCKSSSVLFHMGL